MINPGKSTQQGGCGRFIFIRCIKQLLRTHRVYWIYLFILEVISRSTARYATSVYGPGEQPGYLVWFLLNYYQHVMEPGMLAETADLERIYAGKYGSVYRVTAFPP